MNQLDRIMEATPLLTGVHKLGLHLAEEAKKKPRVV